MDTKKSVQTLCVIIKDSKVLLGIKTRKLGKGFTIISNEKMGMV